MTNKERLTTLRSDIANLDNLIALEMRKLRRMSNTLTEEHYKSYFKLTKRRNTLLIKGITLLNLMANEKKSVDLRFKIY